VRARSTAARPWVLGSVGWIPSANFTATDNHLDIHAIAGATSESRSAFCLSRRHWIRCYVRDIMDDLVVRPTRRKLRLSRESCTSSMSSAIASIGPDFTVQYVSPDVGGSQVNEGRSSKSAYAAAF